MSVASPVVPILSTKWVADTDNDLEVQKQTQTRKKEQDDIRLKKVNIYVRIFYDIALVGIIVCVWMAGKYYVSSLSMVWDVVAIVGGLWLAVRILWKSVQLMII